MLFYKIQGITTATLTDTADRKARKEVARQIVTKSEEFNNLCKDSTCFFVVDNDEGTISAGVITENANQISAVSERFMKHVGFPLKDTSITEITLNTLQSLLSTSYHNGYIENDDDILEKFNLDKISGRCGLVFGESMVEDRTKEELVSAANNYFMNETLLPELDRIFECHTPTHVHGHPVHYMVQTDDRDTRREVYKIILDALYAKGRLVNRRYAFWDARPGASFSQTAYNTLYKTCEGGAVVVRYLADDDTEDSDVSSGGTETIEILCEMARRYRNKVLTVICLPRECNKTKLQFFENLGSISMIEVCEDFIMGDSAVNFLKNMARSNHIRTDKQLFSGLEADRGYLAPELTAMFDEWYNNKLKSTIYPQYKDISVAKKESAKEKPRGSAYDELQQMIGLTEAKNVIRKAINYYKIQKLYEDKGVKRDRPAMHMIFSGNPGTAKTTVARLFARIMRENGLVSKGQLVEVGRGDLVGKYVGWTAQTVQAKFKAAVGGVLFIDEAYSLVDGHNGSFGDEAINTIVQEMENHREDVVVIFAGYPDKMEDFLQRNPGLRSRIAFHVPFSDYNTEELCQIAELISHGKGMQISDDAMNKLSTVFDVARQMGDFGNGRYVRNIFEQAKMNQASRLLELDLDTVTDKQIFTITADDIIVPDISSPEKRRIGFC